MRRPSSSHLQTEVPGPGCAAAEQASASGDTRVRARALIVVGMVQMFIDPAVKVTAPMNTPMATSARWMPSSSAGKPAPPLASTSR
jgi:hypothetical protein